MSGKRKVISLFGLIFLGTALILLLFSNLSCQRGKEAEGERKVHAQKEEPKQPPSDTKKEVKALQPQPNAQEVKKGRSEILSDKKTGVLTEDDQDKFEGVFGQEEMSEQEALQNLGILLKGSPEPIWVC